MVHKLCTLYESTIAGVYSHIYTPRFKQPAIDIMMHAWFTTDVRSWSSIFQVYMSIYASRIIHIVQTSGCIRDAQVIHSIWVYYPKCIYYIDKIFKLPLTSGWFTTDAHCSSSQPQVYIPETHIHYNQRTKDIRIHAWFASYGHCWSPLCRVYIPTYTHISPNSQTTLDVRMHACFTSYAH